MSEYSNSPGARQFGALDANAEASLLAQIVLDALPEASSVLLDTYLDDDTFDCGPVLDSDGSVILGDVSDLALSLTVEAIIAGWRLSALNCADHVWFHHCPLTGESRISLELALSAGRAWGAHDLEAA